MDTQLIRKLLVFMVVLGGLAMGRSLRLYADGATEDGDLRHGSRVDKGNAASVRVPGLNVSRQRVIGNGCPEGSASVTLSSDQRTLSVLFDAFTVTAGKVAQRRVDQRQCVLEVPLQVPAGYQVSVTQVDVRGFHSIPAGAMGTVGVAFGLQGRRTFLNKGLVGPLDGEFVLSGEGRTRALSACGGSLPLNIELRLGARTNAGAEQAFAQIDSLDGSRKVEYSLLWEKCERTVGGGRIRGLHR